MQVITALGTSMNKGNFISKYYLATPIFMLVELLIAPNVRVTIPWGESYFVYIYMGLCFGVGGFVLKKQTHINVFALFESSVNIFLLVLSIYLPIISIADNPESEVTFKFGVIEIVHFAIVAFTLLYVFYGNPLIRKNA